MAIVGYDLDRTGASVKEALDRISSLTLVTTTTDGLMSSSDKAKLDAVGIRNNTTAYWNAQTGYIPAAGEIIIYSDYKTIERDGETVSIPGIKIGSGNGYVQDLAFIGDAEAADLIAHINNTSVHVTSSEKAFWSDKLNVDDNNEVVGETLIFNRD